ncbi:hypothetical protein [Brucella pituitosa]|uniref:Uncharacterized protein n=1 Tax=Brucella pituitosa TaxID=571256 RepID=A0A643EUZ3_9HYPH|nr:hypothetical protein [Brucella pituitosa]KAB0566168.1 hypothetical protein F7Q93_22305 [Brucella pituitosa]
MKSRPRAKLKKSEINPNTIQYALRKGNVLIIKPSKCKCEEIGIEDGEIYIDFLESDNDERAIQIAICWLPVGAQEHQGCIANLNYNDIVRIFGKYTLFIQRCEQEKLIEWIALHTTHKPI